MKENNQEKKWDQRAQSYNEGQRKSNQKLPHKVVAYLLKRFPEIKSVLDVGGGSGRYALIFSEDVDDVLVTDISTNMLKYAEENAIVERKKNIRFKKIDFEKIGQDVLNEKFDLVFSSMCPATRTINGAENMMSFSNGYCAIHQFIKSEDDFSGVAQKKDPHNDPETVLNLFTHLFNMGLDPEIQYFSETISEIMTPEDLLNKYGDRVAAIDFPKSSIEVVKKVKSALIIWRIREIGGIK